MNEEDFFCKVCGHFWNQHINYKEIKQEVIETEEEFTNQEMQEKFDIASTE